MTSYQEKIQSVAENHSYETGFNGRLSKYRIKRIEEALQHQARFNLALEIGCGEGVITEYLAPRFKNLTAIEPAKRFFENASQRLRGSKVSFYNTLFEEFESKEEFDVIVAAGVLEHVQETGIFLKKVYDLISRDGIFMLTVPNAGSMHRRVGKYMGMLSRLDELGELDKKVGHFRYYDFNSLRIDLENNGFSIVSLKGIVLKPLPNPQMDLLTEKFCDALYQIGEELPEYCAEIFVVAKKENK